MCKHDPYLYKLHRPKNSVLVVNNGVVLVTGGYFGGDSRMLTDVRMPWWHKIGLHPLSPVFDNPYMNDDNCMIYCPYCNHSHEPEGDDYHGGDKELECNECEREFCFSSEFGSGFRSSPMPCKNGAHHTVFSAQYYHDGRAVQIGNCIYCGEQSHHETNYTPLPWRPEYDDPDTFDPEGILKTGADLSVRVETPVLDYLRGQSEYGAYTYRTGNAQQALAKHDEIYGGDL